MNFVSKEHHHFTFDRAILPVLTAQSGQEVTFETFDACLGEVRTTQQYLWRRSSGRKSGPLTGPVYVEGATPGMMLAVDILDIRLDETGFQLIGPNRAIVRDEIPDWTCYEFCIRDDRVIFPNGIELPADPVVGTLGNAPAREPYKDLGPLGGNQDVPAVRTGSRVYLPIQVPGALFSLGDVHARQGDGEVVGAPEIGAQATVRLTVLDKPLSDRIMIEDEKDWHSPVGGQNEYEAARAAVFHNAGFIHRNYGVALKDSLLILTMIGRLTISRTGTWGVLGPVVCSSFSKELLAVSLANYRKA